MTSKWETVRLGDICKLTKGSSPTLKTAPGPYPLVVTGPDRKTSDDHQFDGEAVCIPMVSSTGHGHASLKRVHYVSGKFAAANIITVAEVLDPSLCSTKYLYHYLQCFKDELIVTLMKGTANVSLSQKSLLTIPIELPPLSEQRRIVDLIGALDNAIEATEENFAELMAIRSQLGDSVWSSTAERIQIGSIGKTSTGATPPTKNENFWSPAEVPFITPSDMDKSGANIIGYSRFVSELGASKTGRAIDKFAVLQVCIGASIGKVGVASERSVFNQQINCVAPSDKRDATFTGLMLSSSNFQNLILSEAGTSTMPIVSKGKWSALSIPWPSEAERSRVAELAEALGSMTSLRNGQLKSLCNLRSELLIALLSGAHGIPESYDEVLSAV